MSDDLQQAIYFIGIALPSELNKIISDIQWSLYDSKKHYLKPLLPHVTLLHPPSVKGITPQELLPYIKEVASRYVPFVIELEQIDYFGERVVYIRAQSHNLISLQSQLVHLLPKHVQDMHYKREYTPHVTLAQVYEPYSLDTAHVDEITSSLRLPCHFTVSSVSYFKRILPREYKASTV